MSELQTEQASDLRGRTPMVEPKLGVAQEPMMATSSDAPTSRLQNCRDLQPVSLSPGYRFAKRLTDIVGATVFLVLFAPLLLILGILVKLSSPGPVFYKSQRIGLLGQKFTFVKFRSMRPDADTLLQRLREQNEKDGPIFKMKNDPRITPVGRVLRRYSLDELPQFWSVLIGDMSLVGPRPPIAHEVLEYDDACLERLRIKPGITCYWQVMGRSRLSFQEWMELDRKYVREMSFWTDLKIMALTPIAVFRSDGAY